MAKNNRHGKLLLEFFVILVSLACMLLLLYFVMIVSFQNGETSTGITMMIAERISRRIFATPTEDQVLTISYAIRYAAHLGLFFTVGVVTTFVSMVICRRYYRILGVLASGGLCYLLAYFTEYYKQFVEGRHFQISDAALNWYGSVAGILSMVIAYFLNRLLVKLSG